MKRRMSPRYFLLNYIIKPLQTSISNVQIKDGPAVYPGRRHSEPVAEFVLQRRYIATPATLL